MSMLREYSISVETSGQTPLLKSCWHLSEHQTASGILPGFRCIRMNSMSFLMIALGSYRLSQRFRSSCATSVGCIGDFVPDDRIQVVKTDLTGRARRYPHGGETPGDVRNRVWPHRHPPPRTQVGLPGQEHGRRVSRLSPVLSRKSRSPEYVPSGQGFHCIA